MRFFVLLIALLLACEDHAPAPSGPLDINRATVEQLEKLPGVGPKRARSIMAARNARGGRFASLAEVESIDGIGPGTIEAIRPHVFVGP